MDEKEKNNDDFNEILKYLLAGGLLGAGGALSVGTIKMINNNRKLNDSSQDDDTVYLYKQSSISDGLKLGVAGFGALGGFMLGDDIIKEIRSRQAQKYLDDAQEQALQIRGYSKAPQIVTNKKHDERTVPQKQTVTVDQEELNKSASFFDTISTSAGALAALLMLGGGVATYNYLDEKYPTKDMEDLETPSPTRFKIIDKNSKNTVLADDQEKELVQDVIKNATADMRLPAFMLHSTEKQASMASNVISVVANGGLEQFENAVNTLGFKNSLNLVKGASANSVDPVAEQLAILYCTKQASFSPQFNLLVAAEFAHFNPGLMKSAASLNYEEKAYMRDFIKDANNIIKIATAIDLGATNSSIIKAASSNVKCYNVKAAMESIINKRANSFLMSNNNTATASQLSGGGVSPFSKKDSNLIQQEAEVYKQAVESTTNNQKIQDPIDTALSEASTTLNDIK